jgi:pyruvate,water dikinase
MTDPDWEPLMKISSGIITNRGGRTCHASIVARELGVPAIVATLNGTEILKNNQEITLSCAEGEIGKIYEYKIPYTETNINIKNLPKINTKLLLNIASPEKAFFYHNYPVDGVGLIREEFIFSNYIKVHPMALLNHRKIKDQNLSNKIQELCIGYENEIDYFVKKLSYGIAKIACTFYPKPVIVRFSDFKSNEYCNLLGGNYFEPKEENPMIGWRGASRYYSNNFKEAFGLECKAIKYIRQVIGLDNLIVMIPFCRTVNECKLVLDTMKEYGLERGVNGLQVYLMCEIPSNVILADEFCKYVDGYSIGSNDLTQLTLGLDRDSELVQDIYDERNDAVKTLIKNVIFSCKKNNTKIGICGQGPSDYPEFAEFLVREGIDTISITPDSLIKTINIIHKVEKSKL